MRIVVPVKQVPQVASLRFDAERGRAVRADVPLVLNAYDRRALGEALRLRGELGGDVTVLTMGPSRARAALEECVRLGADRAVHLCDDAFADADTLATARALAAAIRRLGADLVLCGQRSVDAETGVVGPMLATLLGLPFATAVTRVTPCEPGTLEIERLTDVGVETLMLPLPCLLTAAERLHRPEAGEPAPRRSGQGEGNSGAEESAGVRTWTAADLGLSPAQVGAAGSRTRVLSIRTGKRPRRCEVLPGVSEEAFERLVDALLERPSPPCPPLPRAGEGGRGVRASATPPILILPDLYRPWAARRLARLAEGLGATATVLDAEDSASQLVRAIQNDAPTLVLATDTPLGRDLLATVAARRWLALVTGVDGVRLGADGGLLFDRPTWGGGVQAEVEALTAPVLVTVRPDTLARDAALSGPSGTASSPGDDMAVDAGDADVAAARRVPALALDVADVVVGAGTGVGDPEGLAAVERLAAVLGAAVGGTRKLVDLGLLPPQQQIGLSGRQIAPRVYLALGTRGSFNHAVGIRRAGTILAVNSDPRAEIFRECDLGLVADWRVVVPMLTEHLARRRRG